jgi:hypothetical protein
MLLFEFQFVIGRKCSKAMREIGARKCAAIDALVPGRLDPREIGGAIRPAAPDDAIGSGLENGMKWHEVLRENF